MDGKSAGPVDLVNILYQRAIGRVRLAAECLRFGDHARKSAAISEAIAIVDELEDSLDRRASREIRRNLANLYQ